MYELYCDKDKNIITVKAVRKSFYNDHKKEMQVRTLDGGILDYNGYYYFSTSRKNLVTFAREMKQKWIEELNNKLNELSAIKI